ncbi:helix-turn-helix domain-containing protein [Tumebacillus permanentifrigoris]|uniref:DNA-binding XRE family transcriptional regulator n=1 Tax=Tumebacillus permanentifrigoris TaxID=378543 RepID=A0A316DAC7_9BACL|nr:helix-turn-helix transcriptional regulator [Tumebacillus permanentifrigoris]PWK14451.1 DNA-binding XRE family transcriptional regulator [Tumebacillus permanentifrigoris]
MNLSLHTNETLGERVKRLRNEREMSQGYLAKFCEVTNGWISKLENDKYAPSPEMITKLAVAFKIPVHELLQEEDKRMELVSRIRLIEALLERNQSKEAESFIVDLEAHPELTAKERMTLIVHLAECRYQQTLYNEVFELLQPLIEKLEVENYHDAHFMALIRNKIGNAYTQKQDTERSLYNYHRAYDYIPRFALFDELAAFISYNVGLALRRKGRSLDAIFYLQQAGEYYKTTNDIKRYADSLFVQGIAFKNRKEYETANELLEQAKLLYKSLNLSTLGTKVQITVATSITSQTDPVQAIGDLKVCARQFENDSYFPGVIFIFAKMANIYLELNDLISCRDVLQNALEIKKNHQISICLEAGELLSSNSRYLLAIQKLEEAIQYSIKSSEIFGILGMVRDQIEALKIAVAAYQSNGNFECALLYQTKRNDLLEQLMEER